MSNFLRAISWFVGAFALAWVQISFTYLLPFPLQAINWVLLILLLILFFTESGLVVWTAFFTYFLLELFSYSTPFGIGLFSGTISLLCAYWLYQHTITNRSWYAAGALTFFTLILFRVLYLVGWWMAVILGGGTNFRWSVFVRFTFWEVLLTTLTGLLVFFILSRFSTRLQKARLADHLILKI